MKSRSLLDPQNLVATGATVLQKAKAFKKMIAGGASRSAGLGDTRFTPPAPAAPIGEDESDSTWGFADTRFEAKADDHVIMTGTRYELCKEPLPTLIPWVRGIMHPDIRANDRNPYSFPPEVPAPVENAAFEQAAKALLGEANVSRDDRLRLRRGHGQTQEEMYAIKYGKLPRVPDLVVAPETEEQVVQLVQLATDHRCVLIPYGGGTNVTDALRCPIGETRTIVSVDMRRMNKILWIDPVNRMACIQAGMVGRHIAEQLAKHGLTIGHEPDSIEFSTMGGWVATHASGMKKNKYGNIEDLLIDITVVTNQGVLQRSQLAPREAVGIDPRLWLLGSEGKLGIITSAVVKLFPLPEVQRYGSVLFPNFEKGCGFMYELACAGNWPASVRLMDNMQFQFGQALKPANKGWKVHKSKIEKIYVTKLQGFEPEKLCACTLVFEGTEREVAAQEQMVYEIAKKYDGMPAGPENGRRGYQLTYGIAYIRDFVMDHWVLAESFETSVPWSKLVSLVENTKRRLYDECERRGLPGKPFVTARVTQVYETGAAVYFYFAFYYKGVEDAVHIYHEIENVAREEIMASGGSLSHHHGVGKLRQHFLRDIMSDAGLQMQAQLKQALDPHNVFGVGNQLPDRAAGDYQ